MDIKEAQDALVALARKQGKEHLLYQEVQEPDDTVIADLEAQKRAQYEAFIASLPESYRDVSFESWDWIPELGAAHRTVRDWSEAGPFHGSGLYLHSRRKGTGKTHLAIAAGKVLARGRRVRYVNVVSLMERVYIGYRDPSRAVDVEALGRNCDYLILDDLGAEKISDRVDERLYLLINTAIGAHTKLIVTTNLTYAELAMKCDDRTVSRIVGATDAVDMESPEDYRKRIHKQRKLKMEGGDDVL